MATDVVIGGHVGWGGAADLGLSWRTAWAVVEGAVERKFRNFKYFYMTTVTVTGFYGNQRKIFYSNIQIKFA